MDPEPQARCQTAAACIHTALASLDTLTLKLYSHPEANILAGNIPFIPDFQECSQSSQENDKLLLVKKQKSPKIRGAKHQGEEPGERLSLVLGNCTVILPEPRAIALNRPSSEVRNTGQGSLGKTVNASKEEEGAPWILPKQHTDQTSKEDLEQEGRCEDITLAAQQEGSHLAGGRQGGGSKVATEGRKVTKGGALMSPMPHRRCRAVKSLNIGPKLRPGAPARGRKEGAQASCTAQLGSRRPQKDLHSAALTAASQEHGHLGR